MFGPCIVNNDCWSQSCCGGKCGGAVTKCQALDTERTNSDDGKYIKDKIENGKKLDYQYKYSKRDQ
jgi:hypothetical protein